MPREDDLTTEHFDWLVEARSRNQLSTLALYKLIGKHDIALSRNVLLQANVQDLAAVAFSLWRAVFLSNLSEVKDAAWFDVKKFLNSLIAHNAILYQTDYNTREWTFWYYLDNATARLDRLASDLFSKGRLELNFAKTAKDNWVNAQSRLEKFIEELQTLIEAQLV